MTGKEKIRLALEHRAGPVPVDFGGMSCSSMHVTVVDQLRAHYGLQKKPVRIAEIMQLIGVIDDDLKEAIGVCTTPVPAPGTIFGFKDEGGKLWEAPFGLTVEVPEGFVTTTDEKGNVYLYAGSDTRYPPSGVLPAGGYFFDAVRRGNTFDEDNPHVEDNLEEFADISEADLGIIRDRAEAAAATSYAPFGAFGGTAIGDISMVPGMMLKNPKGIRDEAEWYMATVANQDYLHQIFTYQTEIALKNLARINAVVGDKIMAAYVCGTDFGTQVAPFCSNNTFRELYMPYYKKINGWIHQNTSWKTIKHSCGSIRALIPLLIESGFDILNPVQWSAENMDPATLKADFGNDIVFLGGGVNTQTTMAFGSPKDVREEVLKACGIFSKDGGFIFSGIHNIQANTPIQNVVAMIEAVKEFNG